MYIYYQAYIDLLYLLYIGRKRGKGDYRSEVTTNKLSALQSDCPFGICVCFFAVSSFFYHGTQEWLLVVYWHWCRKEMAQQGTVWSGLVWSFGWGFGLLLSCHCVSCLVYIYGSLWCAGRVLVVCNTAA